MAERFQCDWREAQDYEWLLKMGRPAWAWEWLRRDRQYRRQALLAIGSRASHAAATVEPEAAAWGLHRFEDPRVDARRARPMWMAAAWPQVLQLDAEAVDAASAASAGDAFDLLSLGHATLVTGTSEHWLEMEGGHALRLDVLSGTLAKGPARLWLELRGPSEVKAAIIALRQLAALWSGRELPGGEVLSPARAARLLRLLRVADALAAGASQRAIAEVLFNARATRRWRLEQASVRLQAQRLVRNARAMGRSGYRRILSGEA